jgi:CRP-like cAMP-binding protein
MGDSSHIRREPASFINGNMDGWSTTAIMKNELYANLAAPVQQQLVDTERWATVSRGSKLIQCGVSPNQLIILNTGLAEISVPIAGKVVSLETAGPGRVLGLRSIICDEVPEIDVTCLEECQVTLLPRDVFLKVLHHNPEMYFAVVKVLSADLKAVQSFLRDKTRRAKSPVTRASPATPISK